MNTKIDISKFFNFPSENDWQVAAEKLLKGRSFEKTLFTQTDEGILLKPIYHSSFAKTPLLAGKSDPNWYIAQTLFAENDSFNSVAVNALENGQDALNINLDFVSQYANSARVVPARSGTVHIAGNNSFKQIFSGIDLENVPVFFDAYCTADKIHSWFTAYLESEHKNLSLIQGSLGADPITAALKYGGFPDLVENLLKSASTLFNSETKLDVITISADFIHNCGTNKIQDLVYILSSAVFYLGALQEHGLSAQEIFSKMRVKIALNSDQLMEIARIRALKILWLNLCKAYDLKEYIPLKIDAVTSWRSMSYFDPWSNMLRSTGQAFAAACGGVESIDVLPFDIVSGKCTDFSRRIARNIQLILKEESRLASVADPAAGSAAIENLTNEIVVKAWKQFQEIEESGGILDQIFSGALQEKITRNNAKQLEDFNYRKRVSIGNNVYANNFEKRPYHNNSNLSFNFLTQPAKQPVPALREKRLSEHFEKLRLAVENLSEKPTAWLFQIGEVQDYKVRSDFSKGFFETAGFKLSTARKAKDITEHKTGPLVILCSSDKIYEKSAIPAAQEIKAILPGAVIMLAGSPGNKQDEYTMAGIRDFINLKTNMYESLKMILIENFKIKV